MKNIVPYINIHPYPVCLKYKRNSISTSRLTTHCSKRKEHCICHCLLLDDIDVIECQWKHRWSTGVRTVMYNVYCHCTEPVGIKDISSPHDIDQKLTHHCSSAQYADQPLFFSPSRLLTMAHGDTAPSIERECLMFYYSFILCSTCIIHVKLTIQILNIVLHILCQRPIFYSLYCTICMRIFYSILS